MKKIVSWIFMVLVGILFVFYSCSTTPDTSSSSNSTSNTNSITSA